MSDNLYYRFICIQNYKLSSHHKTVIIDALYSSFLQEHCIQCNVVSYFHKFEPRIVKLLKPDATTRGYGMTVECPM